MKIIDMTTAVLYISTCQCGECLKRTGNPLGQTPMRNHDRANYGSA